MEKALGQSTAGVAGKCICHSEVNPLTCLTVGTNSISRLCQTKHSGS
jgi:hypothetical protein